MGTKYSLIMDNTQICLTIDRGDISPLLSLTTPQFSRISIFDIIFQWNFSTTLVQLKPLYTVWFTKVWTNPKFPNIFQHSWLRGGNTLTTIVKLLRSCQSYISLQLYARDTTHFVLYFCLVDNWTIAGSKNRWTQSCTNLGNPSPSAQDPPLTPTPA